MKAWGVGLLFCFVGWAAHAGPDCPASTGTPGEPVQVDEVSFHLSPRSGTLKLMIPSATRVEASAAPFVPHLGTVAEVRFVDGQVAVFPLVGEPAQVSTVERSMRRVAYDVSFRMDARHVALLTEQPIAQVRLSQAHDPSLTVELPKKTGRRVTEAVRCLVATQGVAPEGRAISVSQQALD